MMTGEFVTLFALFVVSAIGSGLRNRCYPKLDEWRKGRR